MAIESPRRRYGRERTPLGSVMLGLFIAAIGLSLLANNLGWGDVRHYVNQFWPAMLMLFGMLMLIRRHEGHGQRGFWGSVFIFGGLWAWASQQGWIHVNFWAVFGPTLLILLGGSFVWRAWHQHQQNTSQQQQHPIDPALPGPSPGPNANTANRNDNAYIRAFAIMSGHELKPTSPPFEGADIGAVMGGVVLDLNGAQMHGDSATIDVFTVLGGIEIFVPREWHVITKVTSFMGACVDKRRPTAAPGTKTLVVRGFAMLGGIDIKD